MAQTKTNSAVTNSSNSCLYAKFLFILIIILLLGLPHNALPQSTTFAVIGDFGSKDGNELAVANMVDSWRPKFVITVGDNIYSTSSSAFHDRVGVYYHQYMYPHESTWSNDTTTSNHLWPAVGNHDYINDNLTQYIDYFTLPYNERYYNIKIGNSEFFFINSDTREADGTISNSVQGNWIHQQIQNSNAIWKFVVFHHPAYCSGHDNNYMKWPFEDWGVDAVFSGHVHRYERLLKDDNNDGKYLVYFVDGIGGKGLTGLNTPESGSQIQYNADFGALKVIENSGSLQFYLYSISDTDPIDTYEITSPNPVQLILFNAHFDGTNIQLNWNTATEVNNYGFDIERSLNNSGWNKIGFVFGNGNSNIPHDYDFIDNGLTSSGSYRYRLKQIDNDGKFEYSKVVNVNAITPGQYSLKQNYPNPFNPTTTIEYSIPSPGFVILNVFDALGRKVKNIVSKLQKGGSYRVNFNGSKFSSGVYFYRITVSNSNSISFMDTKSLILQK